MQQNKTAPWCCIEKRQAAILKVEEHADCLQAVRLHGDGFFVVKRLQSLFIIRQAPGVTVESQTGAVLLALPFHLALTQPHLPAAVVRRHVHLPVPAALLQGV